MVGGEKNRGGSRTARPELQVSLAFRWSGEVSRAMIDGSLLTGRRPLSTIQVARPHHNLILIP